MLDLAIAIVHHDPRNAAHRFRVPSGMVMEMAMVWAHCVGDGTGDGDGASIVDDSGGSVGKGDGDGDGDGDGLLIVQTEVAVGVDVSFSETSGFPSMPQFQVCSDEAP